MLYVKKKHGEKLDEKTDETDNETDFGAEDDLTAADSDTSANMQNASSSASGETPRLEPQKSQPKYVKVKSVIDEMDKGR